MNGLKDEYGDTIEFYRLDANDPEMQQIQNDLDLRGHPSVAILDQNGAVIQRFFGVQPAEMIKPYLDAVKP